MDIVWAIALFMGWIGSITFRALLGAGASPCLLARGVVQSLRVTSDQCSWRQCTWKVGAVDRSGDLSWQPWFVELLVQFFWWLGSFWEVFASTA